MALKVFKTDYYKSFGYGAYDEGHGVVVANTESEALGLCLQQHEQTSADGWDIEEIDTTQIGADTIVYSQ